MRFWNLPSAPKPLMKAMFCLMTAKAENLARSFSTLQTLAEPAAAPQIVRTGETSLEELTRELMRPMLKQWIDANLPDIVESMVEREIARITKKG